MSPAFITLNVWLVVNDVPETEAVMVAVPAPRMVRLEPFTSAT